MATKLYLCDIKIDGTRQEPVHLVISRIRSKLGYCKYMFKVVGEYRLVAVMEVQYRHEKYFEHELSLARGYINDITCTPLTALGSPCRGLDKKSIVYWNEMTINHEVLSLENLSTELKRARTVEDSVANIEFFMHKNCRKVTIFISADNPSDAEDVFKKIIQVCEKRVQNVCKEVQDIFTYLNDMEQQK